LIGFTKFAKNLDLGVSDDADYDGYVKSKNKNLTSASISGMVLNNLMDPLLKGKTI
jgi:hypothetical protein